MNGERTVGIRTSGLTKSYFGAAALAPLDLVVEQGQRIALVGHNGSGKSTFLQMLAGVLEPSGGSAEVAGHTVGSVGARAALSYVADEPVFYDDLTVWEHLEFVARLHQTEEWEAHGEHLVHTLGIADRVDDLPTTFSRGLRQKAQLALAFVRPFEVLIADEPYIGLDRVGRAALSELFEWAHDDGATVVVASHDLETVSSADRLVALRDGSVAFDGVPDEADVDELVTAPAPSRRDEEAAESEGGDEATDGGADGESGAAGR